MTALLHTSRLIRVSALVSIVIADMFKISAGRKTIPTSHARKLEVDKET